MGWIEQKPYIHTGVECRKPNSQGKNFGVGSVWECDSCGRRWRFDSTRHEGDQRDSYWNDKWTCLTGPRGIPAVTAGTPDYMLGPYNR